MSTQNISSECAWFIVWMMMHSANAGRLTRKEAELMLDIYFDRFEPDLRRAFPDEARA